LNFGETNFPATACVLPGAGATNNVGSESPKGNGKWGQADLAGNVWECPLREECSLSEPVWDGCNAPPGMKDRIEGLRIQGLRVGERSADED
jgi:hypothetical protein